jgi:hypothetical protein
MQAHVVLKELTQLIGSRMRWRSFDDVTVNRRVEFMRKVLLTGGFNVVGVVLKRGVMLRFVLDLWLFAYFARMCHRLALSAVSCHVSVSLCILGSV